MWDDEAIYLCNACGEEIVVPVDLSEGSRQDLVEDCPVCCHPHSLIVERDPSGHIEIRAKEDREDE